MKYTEALEAIYENPSRVFRAYAPTLGDNIGDGYEMSGSNLYINTTHLSIGEPVSFLSYRMMGLDWVEVEE